MSVTKKMITDHSEAVAQLKKYKKLELELRNKIISKYKFDSMEGIQKKGLATKDFSAEIAITRKLTRKLDADAVESLWSTMSEEERDAINHKPSLDLKAYKDLVETGTIGVLHQAITETPAQPTLKVIIYG